MFFVELLVLFSDFSWKCEVMHCQTQSSRCSVPAHSHPDFNWTENCTFLVLIRFFLMLGPGIEPANSLKYTWSFTEWSVYKFILHITLNMTLKKPWRVLSSVCNVAVSLNFKCIWVFLLLKIATLKGESALNHCGKPVRDGISPPTLNKTIWIHVNG